MNKQNLRPWKGDLVAAFYDRIMIKSVFPRKFRADFEKHKDILSEHLGTLSSRNIIELGTGSGITADFLPSDCHYTGVDVSPRLLKRAELRFRENGFGHTSLWRGSAESLPFDDDSFDKGICLLTLNFISDAHRAIQELYRVLKSGSSAFFSVPCRGLIEKDTGINGTIRSEKEVLRLFAQSGFTIRTLHHNGALLYFDAEKPE